MSYVAPLQDMAFVIHELANYADVAQLPGFEDASVDMVEPVLEEAGRFASEVLAPLNWVGDQAGNRQEGDHVVTAPGFAEAYRQFVEAGWNGIAAPAAFGGQGMPELLSMAVGEIWCSANLSFSLCPMLTTGAMHALQAHASPELQQRYLPNMVSGQWTGTMNLTEPQAGSDLAQVKSRAVPEGEHYRITGQKIFITWGEHDMAENIVHLVLARLPDAPAGVKGISLFVVPKFLVNEDGSLGARNDLRVVSLEHKLGIHASPTCVMAYGDQGGAVGYLVGEANRGLEYMFTMMNHARLGVGLEGVAISERAYQQAVGYARDRVQSRELASPDSAGVAIIRHPDVRRMLLTMRSNIEAMRALGYVTAAAVDRALAEPDPQQRAQAQAFADFMVPIVKGWCTEQANELTALGMQVHGGMGYIEETGAAQHYRDARITAIYEGTTGIQALDLLGRKLARDRGQTAAAVLAMMEQEAQALLGHSDTQLQAIGRRLTDAVTQAGAVTRWMLEQFASQPKLAAAGSVPYLMLMGYVSGGWQMARTARKAVGAIEAGVGDGAFYRAKLLSARFYADHRLPLVAGLADGVMAAGDALLAFPEEAF